MVHGVHCNVVLEHGFKTVLDNVLLGHGGLTCVLPFA